MEDNVKKLSEELKKTKAELWLLHEIGTAMRTTLNLQEVLYVILSAVTSREGLGFNRAMLFLVNEDRKILEGEMAIGPTTADEAHLIWQKIEAEGLSLEKIVEMFHRIESHVIKSPLDNVVKDISIPMLEDGGILAMCVLEGMNYEVTTEELRSKIKDPVLDRLNANLFVCVPLKSKQRVQGALLVDNLITKKVITKDDIRVLTMFANQAGLAIENAYLYEKTKFQAHTDSLTRLWNHGYFQNSLTEVIDRAKVTKEIFTLAMIDFDNFKVYNDMLGHQKGDVALREVASVLKKNLRSQDLLCRYGGEEFTIIMPNIYKRDAFNIIERLRTAVEQTFKRSEQEKASASLTISSGIASFPQDANNKEELIKKADEAMYKAKESGKNKTVIY